MKPITERRRRSARQDFANCPRLYEGVYLNGVATENDATRRGNVFHDARARYILSLFKTKEVADKELADESWHRAITDAPLPAAEYHDCKQLWSEWTERYELNLQTFYSAEQAVYCKPFNCWLRMDETHVPTKDTFRIIDAKTSWRMPSPQQARESVQTGMYLAGARMLYPGFQTYEIAYDYVRMNTQLTVSLSNGELDGWLQWVKESDEAMDMAETMGSFPPKGGSHCAICRVTCDLADHADIQPLRFLTPTDAEAAVSRMAARAQATAADMDALRGYTDEHGPVASGGIEWAHRPATFKKYPAEAVADVLKNYEVKFPLWLSYSAVKPLVTSKRKYQVLQSEIERLAVESTFTKFSAKNVTETDAKPEDE